MRSIHFPWGKVEFSEGLDDVFLSQAEAIAPKTMRKDRIFMLQSYKERQIFGIDLGSLNGFGRGSVCFFANHGFGPICVFISISLHNTLNSTFMHQTFEYDFV